MKKKILIFLFFINYLFANSCSDELFSFNNSSENNISLSKFLQVLVINDCGLNIIYKDELAKKRLENLKIGDMSIKNAPLKQFLDLLLGGNNLFYNIKNNILYISYIKTKTFNIDYISSTRTGSATFQASSSGDSGDTNSVDSKYEFNFWDKLSDNLISILNRTKEDYIAQPPIIDKNAGLVTITATKRQLDRIQDYINNLNDRLHKQILIDVRIYSVDLAESHQTGINWSNLSFSLGKASIPMSIPLNKNYIMGAQSIFNNSLFNISGLLNFLSTQGNVNSISNPKIATVNNQKAIISVGDTINYKEMVKSSYIDKNGNLIPASYKNSSKFVGILLDITPEISEDKTIILRINPTISSFRDQKQLLDPTRTLPPDTTDNKLSTVVRIKDGQTLILGGLITNNNSFNENGVDVLKEIPIVKYLFSSKSKISSKRELVFVVTPHVVDFKKKRTLKDLGF